jgi:subtilisin family serine protease/subtilisin-like proprotein convertase family protein
LTAGRALELSRTITSNIFILQAPDAVTAAREAHRLAALTEVVACYPVMRREAAPHGPYAPRSNDPFAIPYFFTGLGQTIESQWPIEDRDGNSARLGVDLNVMAAWPFGSGQGVTVAVADTGLEMNHPELVARLAGAPHFNFDAQNTSAGPYGGGQFDPLATFWTHGTSVAGLIAAEGNNGRGMIGVAPLASLASWLIYTTNGTLVSDERLMDMYQFVSDIVGVQNHSWGAGNGFRQQGGPTLLEQVGIEKAVTLGRRGLGTVLVRSVGNDRNILASANDDGYVDDPQVIAVGAVNKSGRATSYSEPGSCVLVGAPGGGGDSNQGLLTLDLVGSDRGVNSGVIYFGDVADYRFGVQGFIGTSASAPLVSGVAALLLSANTNLNYRDVQQILLLSARHWDLADPDIATNGAGFLVSHNLGFGVPNAGHAAWLARTWSNRPALVTLTATDSQRLPIPDNGLRVEVSGTDIPPALASIPSFPTFAPHPDEPTPALPLVDIGVADTVPPINLTNKGALILRGATTFEAKISNAAQAGAAFVVIYNSTNGGGFNLGLVSGTDYSPIPAVFIGNTTGETLKSLFQTNATARARLRLLNADKTFQVNSTLLCEQVGVRVQTDHPLRGDLRITLLSPQGTRSVLQHFNDDTFPGPADWTYWTTHDFLESSAGNWTVSFSDEFAGATGSVRSVRLMIRGTQITDSDHDGLDDAWETSSLGSLAYGPKDDPDGDGFSNAREQIMGTNPQVSDILSTPDLSRWGLFGSSFMRLSWPSAPQYSYELRGGTNIGSLSLITNLPGGFPETEWFDPFTTSQNKFFQVRALQAP